jgi:hypothetical protein
VAELGRPREQQRSIERTPDPDAQALRLDYAVEHEKRRVVRGLRLEVVDASSSPQIDASDQG